ncbi:MAG: DUF2284 domain-containing protein [Methanobrevibacter sp.]|jgi:predicted metal-binding protein|nr:DUF2284 domain-containing protein [Candidatus Methanovirga aequatorialis]
MNKLQKLIDKIQNMENIDNFIDAKIIKTSSIQTAFWVRFKCKYGCGGYNTNLNCPPYTPTPEETSELLKYYENAILIKCKDPHLPSQIALDLEKIAIGMEFYKAISFGESSCIQCKKCNLKLCIHKDKVRPSIESCGIDVFNMVRNNGYNMVEYDENGKRTLNFFSLILIQ